MKDNYKILVAAGGTGGHLFPAIAVIQNIERITESSETKFVGTPNRIESRVVPELGYHLTTMPITGYTGLFSLNTWLLPVKILKSIKICRKLIKDFKPDAVLCTGAYIGFPAGMAAWNEQVPLVLMESNVNPGKTIKSLSAKASLIITSFSETEDYFEDIDENKIHYIGNPVRENLLNLPDKKEARKKLGLNPDLQTVLIFGGSLGALTINKATEKVIEYFKEKDIQFIWQTGKAYQNSTKESPKLKILEFIDDMSTAYAAADLVVSRSGATTVAELAVCGKASILIPLPSASNQEQWHNAEVFSKKGAAIILENSKAESNLFLILEELLKNKERIKLMEFAANSLARKEAAKETAKIILEFIDNKRLI